MLLFVGLGNPSPDNEDNRHNIGFKIIDAINQKFNLSKQKPKFKGLLTTGKIENKKVHKSTDLSEALQVISAIHNDDSTIKRFGLSKYPYAADFLNIDEIYLIGGTIGNWHKSQ